MPRRHNTVTQFASNIPQEVKSVLRGLNDEIRLAVIIALMKNTKMSFADLKRLLNLNSSSLSHHLSILQNGGLITNFVELGRNHRSYYMITELTKSVLESLFDIIVIPQRLEEPRHFSRAELDRIFVDASVHRRFESPSSPTPLTPTPIVYAGTQFSRP